MAETEIEGLSPEDVRQKLVDSGLWPAFRQRPFSIVPPVDSVPGPRCLSPRLIPIHWLLIRRVFLAGQQAEFVQGLRVLRHWTMLRFIWSLPQERMCPGRVFRGLCTRHSRDPIRPAFREHTCTSCGRSTSGGSPGMLATRSGVDRSVVRIRHIGLRPGGRSVRTFCRSPAAGEDQVGLFS
ncbi:MAG: hypothetical protein Ct9H300mP1_33720 [Planctomycetaceae bacterium]|nr:MAG: hypothetical protein Ct9H300mP1_33720 [Planctomycetaceae bacterium]